MKQYFYVVDIHLMDRKLERKKHQRKKTKKPSCTVWAHLCHFAHQKNAVITDGLCFK